jgi:hypothetical protein
MRIRQLIALLSFILQTPTTGFAVIDQRDIIFSTVECEIAGLDERNAHYTPWRKLRDTYHVFVAVGGSDSFDPDTDMMQVLGRLRVVRKRSEGHIENSRDVVRDLKSCDPGEILWIKQVQGIDEAEAIVCAEIITAEWCRIGVNYLCCYEQGKWHVQSREIEWQKCTSPN